MERAQYGRRQLWVMFAALALSMSVVASANVRLDAEVVAPGRVIRLDDSVTVSARSPRSTATAGVGDGLESFGPDLHDRREIRNDEAASQGLYLVSVRTWRASLADLFYAWIRPDLEVVYWQPGRDPRDEERRGAEDFRNSELVAQLVALGQAGVDARLVGSGVRVEEVYSDSAIEVLLPGDVIVEAGGHPVTVASDLRYVLSRYEPGDHLELVLARQGEMRTVDVVLSEAPEGERSSRSPAVRIGVGVSTVDPRVESPYNIGWEVGELSGPSAGLALALAIYSKVAGWGPAGGKKVVASGALASDGSVVPVGGIRQKAAAARALGADVFVVPSDNAEEARAAAPDLEVLGVTSFEEAIEALGSGNLPGNGE